MIKPVKNMRLSNFFIYTALLARLSFGLAIDTLAFLSTPEASVQPLYVFPNGTAAENLYVRPDGSVLVNMLDPEAALYYFPTSNTTSVSPILLHNFTGSAAAYGITEYAPDVFAICTGTFERSGKVTNATGEVWRVDLVQFRTANNGTVTSPIQVTRLANITNAGFLNGAATLDTDTVLVADSVLGVVYAVDTQTGNYSVVLNDTALAPNASGPVRLGVNGLAVVNSTLYYTNTNRRTVGRVRLTVDGTAAGPYETIASNILVDDIEVDSLTGAVYIPSLTANEIRYVSPNGTVTVLAGSLNSTDVPGPTAIKFARRPGSRDGDGVRLLISTSGGIEYPINGTYIQGGGLYELNVTGISA